ncbi:MAG: DUF4355 domain-containing protein [bacterium]|nr:DUF4355 domain-containing protein [bacterium]
MEGNEGTAQNAEPQVTGENPAEDENEAKPEKMYTQEQVDEMLRKQQSSFEDKLTESEKLARMSAKEKSEYEASQREKAVEEREKAVARRELKQTAAETLKEKGLDAELAAILDYTDADSVSKSIKAVEKSFNAAVERAVKGKLKASGGIPGMGGKAPAASGVEAAFYKLNPRLKK